MFLASAKALDIAKDFLISSRGSKTLSIKMPGAWLVLFVNFACMELIHSPDIQDEYMNLDTLELRLQQVARRYVQTTHVNPNQQQQPQQQSNYAQEQKPILSTSSNPMGLVSQGGMGIAPQGNYHGVDQKPTVQHSSNGASASSPTLAPVGVGQAVNQMVPSSALGSSMPVNAGMMSNGASAMIKRDMNVSSVWS